MLVHGCSPASNRQHWIASGDGLRPALASAANASPAWLRAFYASRDFAPVWTTGKSLSPAGQQLVALLRDADEEGLDPQDYLQRLSPPGKIGEAEPPFQVRAEIGLSLALKDYLRDLTQAPAGFFYVDGDVPRRGADVRDVLSATASGMPLRRVLAAHVRPNSIYLGLKQALAEHRRTKGPGHGRRSTGSEQWIIRNMDRSRALPAMTKGRFLLVDTAAARLLMIEDGTIRDEMRVIVGKREEQTPDMAGQLRFAIVNPYWNVPPDLVARRARHVLAAGTGVITAERLELLSDWSSNPRTLDVDEVDWQAVADGRRKLRARQLPGTHNMMGKIKFMMPNRLGIYLHDTPYKEAFARTDRRLSSGCVRVEDADRLGRWLFRGDMPATGTGAERRVDLRHPVPVYIVYLTAMPVSGALATRSDGYGRDVGPAYASQRLSGGQSPDLTP